MVPDSDVMSIDPIAVRSYPIRGRTRTYDFALQLAESTTISVATPDASGCRRSRTHWPFE